MNAQLQIEHFNVFTSCRVIYTIEQNLDKFEAVLIRQTVRVFFKMCYSEHTYGTYGILRLV